jgi:hypothetical protein
VDEIMKGAGIDGTTLFQEIHSWVNKIISQKNELFSF